MNVYLLHPEYTQAGDHYAHWVDDGVRLMDTPQSKVGPVLDSWPTDLLFDLVLDGNECDVYMNPCGLCFTERAMTVLSPLCGSNAEWLPIQTTNGKTLYLFHPTAIVPLGKLASFRSHNPDDNIVEVYDYDFDSPDDLPTCFLIPQPATSPAGQAGYAFTGEYVADRLYAEMGRFRGVDFARVFPRKPKRG